MKIKITKDDEYWLSPSAVQAFRLGAEYNLPKKTAEALIEAGAAIPHIAEKE